MRDARQVVIGVVGVGGFASQLIGHRGEEIIAVAPERDGLLFGIADRPGFAGGEPIGVEIELMAIAVDATSWFTESLL